MRLMMIVAFHFMTVLNRWHFTRSILQPFRLLDFSFFWIFFSFLAINHFSLIVFRLNFDNHWLTWLIFQSSWHFACESYYFHDSKVDVQPWMFFHKFRKNIVLIIIRSTRLNSFFLYYKEHFVVCDIIQFIRIV